MHHHINRLLSSDDVLMVIANSGGNPNLSSAKKRVTYATNEVGTTGGRPPVNWCGHHMRHAAIRSTPTLTPSTLYNADWNSPRGNICGTSPNCMKMCMRGQNPNIQPTCMFGLSRTIGVAFINNPSSSLLFQRWWSKFTNALQSIKWWCLLPMYAS